MNRRVAPLAFVVLLGLAGCSSTTPYQEGQTAPASKSASATSTPTPAPAAAGTRENPIPANTLTEYDPKSVWRFSLGAAVLVPVEQIMAENQYNKIPEGSAVVSAPFHVVAKDTMSADGAEPITSLEVTYVTKQGNSYPASDGHITFGTKLGTVGRMYGGAEADALAIAAVPSDAVAGGAWRVASVVQPDKAIFIQGAS